MPVSWSPLRARNEVVVWAIGLARLETGLVEAWEFNEGGLRWASIGPPLGDNYATNVPCRMGATSRPG